MSVEQTPELMTSLVTDALYLRAAREAYASAMSHIPAIRRSEAEFGELRQRELAAKRRHGGDALAAYDELEPVYIQMEDAELQVGQAYAPFVASLAATQIFCACCLEAHINIRADELLVGAYLREFQKLSLEGKWLFLPKHLGLQGFDPGAEPFQSLAILIRYRNALVHYKPKWEKWKGVGPPDFLENLGLTDKAAERSLDACPRLVEVLAEQSGVDPPRWIAKSGDPGRSYFSLESRVTRS